MLVVAVVELVVVVMQVASVEMVVVEIQVLLQILL
tara:strand:+ start:1010 stop:1114 length:105 start_codon:yes stop_codon:yes gene_type:complete